MLKALNYIVARLKEPSTWVGIGGFLVGVGLLNSDAPILSQLPQLGVMGASVLGMLIPEGVTTSGPKACLAFLCGAALLPLLGACTTNAAGQKVVDPQVVSIIQQSAQIACAVTPTAATIANLYTANPDVKTTEAAVTLACNAAGALIHPAIPATPAPAAAPASG